MSFRTKLVSIAQQASPPGLLSLAKRSRLYPWGAKGDYASWHAASLAAGAGYSDTRIAENALDAAKAQVVESEEVALRVSISTSRLLSAALIALWEVRRNTINVLDFGGALGKHYFALRPLLPASVKVRWTICETETMCNVGRQHFANDELSFTTSLEAVDHSADLAIASGSLQYVEQPIETLRALAVRAPFVIVDRVPLTVGPRDRLTVQKVPPWLGRAAHPVWILSESTWQREVGGRVVVSWECDERWQLGGEVMPLRGLLLRT